MEVAVIRDIISCAQQYHSKPATTWLLVATALVESGANYHPTPGDNNTSFGPFQHHRGGALDGTACAPGMHTQAWAESKAAVCERVCTFTRANARTGSDAARIQAPADPQGYAVKVNNSLHHAKQLLADYVAGTIHDEGPITVATDAVSNSGPVKAVTGAAGSVGDFVSWITNTGNMIRVGKVVGGGILLFTGVFMVAKAEGIDLPKPPAIIPV